MKHITHFLILFLFSIPTFGQETASQLLDQIAAKIKNNKATQIEFTLTIENKDENIKESHPGAATLCGGKYKVDLMGAVNLFDGNNIYTYMPEMMEVTIKNPSDEEEAFLNPTTLFSIHKKGFKSSIVERKAGTTTVLLVPENKNSTLEKIEIFINDSKKEIYRVTTFGKDGNQIHLDMKQIKALAEKPSDATFSFDQAKHPDVEIVDLRE